MIKNDSRPFYLVAKNAPVFGTVAYCYGEVYDQMIDNLYKFKMMYPTKKFYIIDGNFNILETI